MSIVLVIPDEAELYLELDPDGPLGRRRRATASPFVRETVAPLMELASKAACATDKEMAKFTFGWLREHRVMRLLADSNRDVFLLKAAGGMPAEMRCEVVQANNADAHDALEDARRVAAALI